MKQTYTIPNDRREDVEKLLNRYQKKAEKYGSPLNVEYGEPYATEVPIYERDENGVAVLVKGEAYKFEAFDLTIDSETIKKDGYTVVAKIEHLNGGNVVSTFNTEIKPAWKDSDCKCEHCNVDRYRRLTFIVRHEDGSEKQVGRTCLKDYCGIDPQAIGLRNELTELLLGFDVKRYDFGERPVERVYNVIDTLAYAIQTTEKYGYVKSGEPNSNKSRIETLFAEKAPITDEERIRATEMAKGISEIPYEDADRACLSNTQALIASEYCKANHFGFIAYAPSAYKKYLEQVKIRAEREAAKDTERHTSDYVGEIGKRIDVAIADMKLATSWETQWGMTWLYKFTDTDGNVLVWFASSPMGRFNANGIYEDITHVDRIKATVKDHTERDGIKQTVITRCKAA